MLARSDEVEVVLRQYDGQFQAGLENDGVAAQDVQRLFTHIEGVLLEPGPDPTDTQGPLFQQLAVGFALWPWFADHGWVWDSLLWIAVAALHGRLSAPPLGSREALVRGLAATLVNDRPVPFETVAVQGFEDSFRRARLLPGRIDIFDAHQPAAAMPACLQIAGSRSEQGPEVKWPGG